jgi:hypothetical protein
LRRGIDRDGQKSNDLLRHGSTFAFRAAFQLLVKRVREVLDVQGRHLEPLTFLRFGGTFLAGQAARRIPLELPEEPGRQTDGYRRAIAFEGARLRSKHWLNDTPLVRPEPGSKKTRKQVFNTDFTEEKFNPQIYTENVKLFSDRAQKLPILRGYFSV